MYGADRGFKGVGLPAAGGDDLAGRARSGGGGTVSGPTVGLRVAFLAGTLDPGGAEKQLVYMVRALTSAGVAVRVIARWSL